MAEVATKKSISVVSNKKNEVCGVQSNNGLLDLDNLTASNNQLISLCETNDDEDDLILTNNTRNELDTDDKSLQELIESELALRISSNAEQDSVNETEDQEEDQPSSNQPETVKRIVLDRRQDTVDVNTEFIRAETEHCSLIESELALRNSSNSEQANEIETEDRDENDAAFNQPETVKRIVLDRRQDIVDEEPYSYQNGHVSPDASYETKVKPEPILNTFYDEEQVFSEEPEVGSAIAIEETDANEIEQPVRGPVDDGRLCSQTQDDESSCPIEDPVSRGPDTEDKSSEMSNVAEESVQDVITGQLTSATPVTFVDKYQEEEEDPNKVLNNATADLVETDAVPAEDQRIGDMPEAWAEQVTFQEAGHFSDNFDQTLGQQSSELFIAQELKSSLMQNMKPDNFFEPIMPEAGKEDDDSSSVDEKIPEDAEACLIPEKPLEEIEEEVLVMNTMESRSFDDVTLSHSDASTDAASTQEYIDTERRVLSEENDAQRLREIQGSEDLSLEKISQGLMDEDEEVAQKEEEVKEEVNDTADEQNAIAESSSELSVSEPTFIENTVFSETKCHETGADSDLMDETAENPDLNSRAPLATPDDETSDVSNACDSESREETITTTSSVVTSSTAKSGTKTKKKKIEGVAGNDASPNLTPRTKKTKKSKKNELEKENISVCRSFGDISSMSDGDQTAYGKANHAMETEEKSSFNKFDALSKKTVLHVRSIDAGKVQQQLNAAAVGQNGDTNPNCRSCGKVVFQMEQTKAEGLVWHKNCFRCVQCSKQLNVDNYESHETILYCKPHFKELFQPKPVEESEQPASDKPDLGLEELSSLNVKSRFKVFEKAGSEANEIERSPSQVAVKRSPSILSKLAKFQAKGMDIGVADESLNGIPYEESSESEEEEEIEETEEADTEIVKAKRATRERPISFTKMDDIKNRWETTSQQGRRKVQREARKEEIAGIRSRLFMGKQGKMKEMYQQAVAGSDRVTKINPAEELQNSSAHARSIKERFERGELIAASDDETDNKPKPEKADEEVIAAGISRKSRSLFLELDASAAKTGRPVTPVNPKTPSDTPRRARDMDSPEREIYRDPDVVRAEDRVNEVVHTDTARKMLSIFRQMEENATKQEVPKFPKPLKRFTPPPEDKYEKPPMSGSEDEEEEEGEESEGEDSTEERDPNYVRASDKVEDEFLKQAQNAARAKTLCAKFEHWDETDAKSVTSSNQHIAEMEIAQNIGEQSSIESASSLRARFESLGSQQTESPRTNKVKVNRFVEIQASCTDVCESCQKKVYPLEKVETNNKIFHKQCFRCLQCNCVLRMDTFTLNNGKLYCIPHFKQLFITRGNYDEGFGVDPHKNKWTTSASNPTSPPPIAVSNGDL